MTRYWIGVVSLSHVTRGVQGGFAQMGHGKAAPLRRMSEGDWLVYYSPRTDMSDGEPLQQFTAIGRVTGHTVYEHPMGPDFVPFRRDVKYLKCEPASRGNELCTLRPLQPQRICSASGGYSLRNATGDAAR